jgi:hypothetical protein
MAQIWSYSVGFKFVFRNYVLIRSYVTVHDTSKISLAAGRHALEFPRAIAVRY